MLYIFRVDIGERYTFETDLAFQDVKKLKSTIQRDYGIPLSKQILIINGGELLDNDDDQVSMKTRETGAGTEENPIYLLDKSHLERSRPIQIALSLENIPTIDDTTLKEWLNMPPTYETIVQRADTAQNFNKYAQKIVYSCERFINEQQTQYQGWMAVIANIEDTLSSFLLNRNSFDRLYQNYLTARKNYLELFQSLPQAIEILHQLKLPNQLTSSMENSHGFNHRSTISSSTSSSSISLAATTSNSVNHLSTTDYDHSSTTNLSLYEWITAQLGEMRIDDILNGCVQVIDECTEDLLTSMNNEIDELSKKISNPELKHMIGIEERFALLQTELTNAKLLQHQQKDCADYLISQRQRFSSNVGNQRDWALIKDISGIHAKNLGEIADRHKKLLDIEKKIRRSKQDIIDQLHRRFKNLMLLQRHLVDHDSKQSLYIHKLNQTRKTMAFLRQLNQTPNLYYTFLYECFRRKQYSNIFNQFSETIHREVKHLYQQEIQIRDQFIKQYEPHFLFNLLPSLKSVSTFFIKEPLPLMDKNLPDLTLRELDLLFEQFPQFKSPTNERSSPSPSAIILAPLIRCSRLFFEEESSIETPTVINPTSNPLNMEERTTTTTILPKESGSPTPSSSRSTVVRSQSSSSSDVESTNESSNEQKANEEENSSDQIVDSPKTISQGSQTTEISLSSPSLVNATSSTTTTTTTTSKSSPTTNNEDEDDYIQCSLETVYTSTEMTVSPPQRQNLNEEKDRENRRSIINEFHLLKTQFEQTKDLQHDFLVDYHQNVQQILQTLQHSNENYQQQIEQLKSEILNHLQDNETLKIRFDLSEESKEEMKSKYSLLENHLEEFRRTSDIEKSQIHKALQSDFEFELEKVRCEHQETLQSLQDQLKKKQILTTTTEIQTESTKTFDQQTSSSINLENQSIQTDSILHEDQSIQTINEENDETNRRTITKDQQHQFNLAIQRAVQNSSTSLKKQIQQLEQQLNDKRLKIVKLKECVKKLQNFYTLSSTSPPPTVPQSSSVITFPSVANSMLTSSTDEEQTTKDEENPSTPDETTNRTAFFRRSEPISMPSTFIVQSMLAAGNAASSPKTEQPQSTTVTNFLMDQCFKSSPSESSAAVELYTPFAASPPNPIAMATSPQTPVPAPLILNSPPSISPSKRLSTNSSPPQASPIAFFTVNRSDRVIIYYDSTYQHYMIYTYLPTLHFVHSDCYELFQLQQQQQRTNLSQSTLPEQNRSNPINSSVIGSIQNEHGNNPVSSLINTSMINSTFVGSNGINPSTIPLLGQVTDKEYCQAKKPNNRFNVPLGTKFYRVRVKPWKPSTNN